MEPIGLTALAVAAITFTMTTASIFEWLRTLMDTVPKLGELFRCPWCLSFWVTAGIMLGQCDYYILHLFAIMTISGLCHYVLLRAYEPVQRAAAERELNKINNNDHQEHV